MALEIHPSQTRAECMHHVWSCADIDLVTPDIIVCVTTEHFALDV